MSNTHINAYHAEVSEKRQALELAQAQYDEAIKNLESKEIELGIRESEADVDEPEEAETKAKGKKVEYR